MGHSRPLVSGLRRHRQSHGRGMRGRLPRACGRRRHAANHYYTRRTAGHPRPGSGPTGGGVGCTGAQLACRYHPGSAASTWRRFNQCPERSRAAAERTGGLPRRASGRCPAHRTDDKTERTAEPVGRTGWHTHYAYSAAGRSRRRRRTSPRGGRHGPESGVGEGAFGDRDGVDDCRQRPTGHHPNVVAIDSLRRPAVAGVGRLVVG
jgi:hypothetical protein